MVWMIDGGAEEEEMIDTFLAPSRHQHIFFSDLFSIILIFSIIQLILISFRHSIPFPLLILLI